MILASGGQDSPCTLYIGAVHLFRIANPKPVISCDMKHHVTACHRLLNGFRIAQIADQTIRIQPLDISQIAAGTNQQPQVGSLLGQYLSDMTSYKTGCASDESFHQSCQLLALSRQPNHLLKAESSYSSFSGCSEMSFSPAAFFSQ